MHLSLPAALPLPSRPSRLDACAIAGILQGNTTSWISPEIAELNAEPPLPLFDDPLTLVWLNASFSGHQSLRCGGGAGCSACASVQRPCTRCVCLSAGGPPQLLLSCRANPPTLQPRPHRSYYLSTECPEGWPHGVVNNFAEIVADVPGAIAVTDIQQGWVSLAAGASSLKAAPRSAAAARTEVMLANRQLSMRAPDPRSTPHLPCWAGHCEQGAGRHGHRRSRALR